MQKIRKKGKDQCEKDTMTHLSLHSSIFYLREIFLASHNRANVNMFSHELWNWSTFECLAEEKGVASLWLRV